MKADISARWHAAYHHTSVQQIYTVYKSSGEMASCQIPEQVNHAVVSVKAVPSTTISTSCTDLARQNETFT